jgi:hypothetical protein
MKKYLAGIIILAFPVLCGASGDVVIRQGGGTGKIVVQSGSVAASGSGSSVSLSTTTPGATNFVLISNVALAANTTTYLSSATITKLFSNELQVYSTATIGNATLNYSVGNSELQNNKSLGLKNQSLLRFYDLATSHYVALKATSTLVGDTVYILPISSGIAGQVLTTDGANNLYFSTPSSGGGISSVSLSTMTAGATNYIFNTNVYQPASAFISSLTVHGQVIFNSSGTGSNPDLNTYWVLTSSISKLSIFDQKYLYLYGYVPNDGSYVTDGSRAAIIIASTYPFSYGSDSGTHDIHDTDAYFYLTPGNSGGSLFAWKDRVMQMDGTGITLDNGAGYLVLPQFDCSGNANGGKLTTDGSGFVSCADDISGSGGSGTTISIEEGGSSVVQSSSITFNSSQFNVASSGGKGSVVIETNTAGGLMALSTGTNAAGQLVRSNSSNIIPVQVSSFGVASILANNIASVGGVSGLLSDQQKIKISTGGTQVAISSAANFAAGSGIGLTGAANSDGSVTITYSATNVSSTSATGVTAGSYGTANQVPSYTVNAQGMLTAASNVAITGVALATATIGNYVDSITVTSAFNLSGTNNASNSAPIFAINSASVAVLSAGLVLNSQVDGSSVTKQGVATAGSGITVTNGAGTHTIAAVKVSSLAAVVPAGTYGSATIVPVITFNDQGQIIAAASATITGGGGGSGRPIEFFNNFNSAESSPTLSVGMTNAFRGSVSGSTWTFEANSSSITLLGQNPPAANIANGFLGSGVVASSVAVASIQDAAIVAVGGAKITGTIPNAAIDGSSVTKYGANIPAAAISAGSLGSSVIASSIAVSAVQDASIVGVGGAKITGTGTIPNAAIDGSSVTKYGASIPAASIAAGALGSSVLTSSVAVAKVGVAQINASGSATSSTFLRGDGSWNSPAGSGDAVLASTQTWSGQNTFTSTTTFTSSAAVNGPLFAGSTGPGTSGKVLTSNGVGLAPTWQTAAAGGGSQTRPSSFTYTFNAEQAGLGKYGLTAPTISNSTNEAMGSLLFDETSTMTVVYSTVLKNYQGGQLAVDFLYTSSATSGTVNFGAYIQCDSPTTAALDTASFGTINSTSTTTNATIGRLTIATVALTNGDSCVNGNTAILKVERSAGLNDTMVGYAKLRKVVFYEQ